MTDTAPVETTAESIADFVDEALESLRAVPGQIAAYRASPDDDHPIHAVFRSVHSIKGCADFLGLAAARAFSHRLENTLDEIRQGTTRLSSDLERALIHGVDVLEAILHRAVDGELEGELSVDETATVFEIEAIAASCRLEALPEIKLLEELRALSDEIAGARLPEAVDWARRIRTMAESSDRGRAAMSADRSARQPPRALSPAEILAKPCQCQGKDVTDFVHRVTAIFRLEDPVAIAAQAANFLAATEKFSTWAEHQRQSGLAAALRAAAHDFRLIVESPLDLDQMLLGVVWEKLRTEFALLAVESVPPQPAITQSAPPSSARPNRDTNRQGRQLDQARQRMLRVREDKLDEFLNDVSGLFITSEQLKDFYARCRKENLPAPLIEELRQITTAFNGQSSSLQRSVVALHRVPISGLFSKVPRMARTLGSQLGKKVDVHISGEHVEVDKSLLEDLAAPLTHLIRNCMDHGIDTPAERRARHLEEVGNIWLHAELTRTHLVVSIRDDGRGIDADRLRAKAIDRGLGSPDEIAAMTHEQTLRLIFHAGISTAQQISHYSGRGVGLDVVLTSLQEHNGDIHVESEPGVGTTIQMKIPIREAVLVVDGLMCQEAEKTFVIPSESIIEVTQVTVKQLSALNGSMVARIRQHTYAAIRLGDLLGLAREPWSGDGSIEAILIGAKTGEICLLVERVCGYQQVILNSMNHVPAGLSNVVGVAPLGSGGFAFVLQVDGLIDSWRDGAGHHEAGRPSQVSD